MEVGPDRQTDSYIPPQTMFVEGINIYLIYVNGEALTIGRMIPSGTNSPPADHNVNRDQIN